MIECATTWAAGLVMAVLFSGGGVEIRPVTAPLDSPHLVLYCRRLPAGFYVGPGHWGIRGAIRRF
jgi:hypothetical protein